jgi:O-antigen/teichoic acid export membrane protein
MKKFFLFTKTVLKRYGKNGLLFVVLQAIAALTQLFILPFLTRSFSLVDFGILQFSQVIINWLGLFTVMQSTIGSKKGIVEGKDATILYAFLYRIKYALALCFLSISIGIGFFFFNNSVYGWMFVIAGLFLPFGYLPQVSFPQLYIAKGRIDLFVYWQSFAIVFSQIITVFVAFFTHNMILTMAAQYASFAFLCSLAFIDGLRRYSIISSYKRGEIDKECIPYGKKLIFVDVFQGTVGTLHNFILGPIFGFANYAIFSLATRIDVVFRSIIASGNYLIYKDFVETDYEKLKKYLKKKFFFLFLLSSFICLGLFFISFIYIKYFLPESYHIAIVYTGILICALPALLIQTVIQAAFESRFKAEAQRRAVTISQVLRILFLVLGAFSGVFGVCIAMSLSAWVSMLCFMFIFFEPSYLKNKKSLS